MAATKKTETKAAVVNETAKPVAEVKEAAPEAACAGSERNCEDTGSKG